MAYFRDGKKKKLLDHIWPQAKEAKFQVNSLDHIQALFQHMTTSDFK